MKIREIAERIEEIVPLKLAQDWDNVGLLIGDSQKVVKNILLTIDVTQDVVNEAVHNYLGGRKSDVDRLIEYSQLLRGEGPVKMHLRLMT